MASAYPWLLAILTLLRLADAFFDSAEWLIACAVLYALLLTHTAWSRL